MSVINLGKQGETNVRQVQLDVSRLVTLFGPGTVQLLHRRPGDVTPYPVALTRTGDVVTWTVTAADTAYSGEGQAELQYFAGDSLAKSETYTTTITASQGDAGATPPEPQAGWVTQVLQAGTDAAEAAERAENAVLHPPIIGENGNWWLWSFTDNVYVDSGTSALGSDADVTADNIKAALGFTPANESAVPTKTSQLTNDSDFITEYTETDPTVPAWAKSSTKPSYTAAEVGADPEGTAVETVGEHNVDPDSHNDIRDLIEGLTSRLNALANSDDTTLDQMAEVVAYIKANRTLIESITTNKVSVADIANNLTTNVTNKPLSAAQGVALKTLIDAITVPTKLSQLTNDSGFITGYTETDPTVPDWAKAASKPSYTADEVGALPQETPIPSVVQTTGDSTTNVMSQDAVTKELNQLSNEKADLKDAVLSIPQNLTEAQKAQVRANIGASAGEDVEFADSVEWLEENGDTSKKYVLPDGYIYTWQYKKETIEHNANDGTGVLNQYPQSTWGDTYGTKNGVWSSPLIEIDPTVMAPVDARNDTIITISGLDKIVPVYNNSSIWTYYYKSTGAQMFSQNGANMGGIGTNSEITLPLSYQLKNGYHFLDSNWAQVAGVRICIGVSTAGAITADDIKNLKVNIPFFNKEIDGYGWYSTGIQHSNDKATQQNSADIATLKEEVATLKEAVSTSPSNSGAVWYAIGDSITYGLYSTSATDYHQPVVGQRWVDYVSKHNGYQLTNLGKSNAGFLTSPTFRSMVDGANFANADLVTIMLGINDWKNEDAVDKVGSFDDDITTGGTIVSELRYGIEKIIADNPYCKIILITPINAKIGSRGTENTNWAYGYAGTITPCGSLKNFGEKLKEVCEYYGIQVIDMTNSSVVNRKSITTTLPDGIHPNLDTYRVLGLELARRITFA